MNKLQIEGKMNKVKGYLKEKYGDLTNDDLSMIEGKEDQFIGQLQERLGKSKEEIINELNNV